MGARKEFQAQLFGLSGAHKGKVFRVKESLLLGRSALCDVRVDDPRVSRKNTRIWIDSAGRLVVTDMGSKNGTQVDHETTLECVLQSGSVVTVGGAEFLIQMSSERAYSSRPQMFRLNLPGGPVEERTIDG